MPLNRFIRDKRFFQDLRDNKAIINDTDYDTQFNNLASFFNDEIKTTIDTIITGVLAGVIGQPNTFLRNVGDGTTDFAPINNDSIPDFVIEFNKLIRATNRGAILGSDDNNTFIEVFPAEANQVLISRVDNTPIWQKVTADNIEDRTITGAKITNQAILAEHLAPNTLVNNLANNSIINSKFTDQSITNQKIIRNSLEQRNFGIISMDGVNKIALANTVGRNRIIANTITASKLGDRTIETIHFNNVKLITAGKFAPNAITNDKVNVFGYTYQGNSYIGTFSSRVLSPNFKLTNRQLAQDDIVASMFEPTARLAFIAKGCNG
jgi:hypothetical protein